LLRHRLGCFETPDGWVFANPVTGRGYHQEEIQKRHIRTAGIAAGIADDIGWHTFRHRSWLDEAGTMTVQKELMRHASIQTMMNVYGKAMNDSKRRAHTKVVAMVFRKRGPQSETDEVESQNAAIGSLQDARLRSQLVETIGCGGLQRTGRAQRPVRDRIACLMKQTRFAAVVAVSRTV
jgi:hypothetical protein